MTFPARWSSVSGGSGTLTAAPSDGDTTAGTALATAGIKLGTLSCLATLLAETNTITLEAGFQVSNDNSTWYDLAGDAQNPANVVFGTGTAGSDTAVSKVLPVPSQVAGWKYVRPVVVNRVTTGGAGDTYAFTFYYVKESGF